MQYFLNLSITKKLVYVLLFIGLAPMLVIAIESILVSNETITQQVSNQLASVRSSKGNQIQRYFTRVRNQVKTVSGDPAIINAAVNLRAAFRSYRREAGINDSELAAQKQQVINYYQTQFGAQFQQINGTDVDTFSMYTSLDADSWALQHSYISNNPNPLGSKENLDSADDGTTYSKVHAEIHPRLRDYLRNFGYYDIFIADAETGDIIYSVYKELDYSTSLKTGPYAKTSIGEAFQKALALNDTNGTVLADFKSYRPSYDAPASFVASPIVKNGRTVAVLIFQMPIEDINAIMLERIGMGETGESYLVGNDFLMRSDSYLDPEFHNVVASFKHPEKGQVKTTAVKRALKGETGTDIIVDYNGNPVLSAFGTVDLGDFQWAVLSEQDVAEAFAPVAGLKTTMFIFSGICALAVLGLGLWISRLIATPIRNVASALQQTAQTGTFLNKVNNQNRDEVGQTAQAFNNFLDSLSQMFSETNTVLSEVAQGNYEKTITGHYNGEMKILADGVNDTVAKINAANKAQQQQQAELAKASEETAQQAREAEKAAIAAEQAAIEANKVRRALDVASTGVMMADESNQIAYLNDAFKDMMANAEADIQKQLPNFRCENLFGQSMDVFHRNPSHQQNLIASLNNTHKTEIEVGGRTFSLIANPIYRDNERIGTVVEWRDRTAEVSIEKEIDSMVEAAVKGDFSVRLNTSGKEGFFASLATGLNTLVNTTSQAIADVSAVISSMAKGDLTQTITTEYEGMFAELQENINATMAKMIDVVGHISQAAEQVKHSSFEISAGMRDLSGRTEEQASSLEETASTMAEMTETVQSSAENANQADDMAKDAERKASEGGEVVKQAIVAMDSINQASKRIADIIGVIDEIAFQTNLLALNAAVEAARAGEQGRGFAVVATEVRQLAQRSSNAAKEIKELINDTVERVEVGSELVTRSGDTLKEIVAAVEQVGETISHIAESAKEQSTGISQVNTAINQIDETTQQNSALVEQTNAAGETIAGQSENMANAVGFFKVK